MMLPSLRVTSTSGENLWVNVNGSNAGRVNVDTPISGPQGTPRIAASAYTNPDANPATGTALFGIDFKTDAVYQQVRPNDGTLTLIGALRMIRPPGWLRHIDHRSACCSLTRPLSDGSALYSIEADGSATSLGVSVSAAIPPSRLY